jgi:hypothetical protein
MAGIAIEAKAIREEEGDTGGERGVESAFEVPVSESTNVWPDEAAEAAFLGETRGADASPMVSRVAGSAPAETVTAPLPKLDELVNRIPAESRELLEELFRAKFTTVRRIKQTDLKA